MPPAAATERSLAVLRPGQQEDELVRRLHALARRPLPPHAAIASDAAAQIEADWRKVPASPTLRRRGRSLAAAAKALSRQAFAPFRGELRALRHLKTLELTLAETARAREVVLMHRAALAQPSPLAASFQAGLSALVEVLEANEAGAAGIRQDIEDCLAGS